MREFVRSLFGPQNAPVAAPRRLGVETLEERAVPAAYDLTTTGATEMINEAHFEQVSPQPTGTGVIRSFVRIQPGGNVGEGQGYNTDARPLQFNENKSPQFTRSLQLRDAPIVTKDGIAYREFLLDINQKSSSPMVSLDELRIFMGNAGNLRGYDSASHTLAGYLTPVYDLDAGEVDNSVRLNARLNSGSGSGDMTLLVRDDLLTAAGGDYVYLYSKFTASNGGFEEWAVRGTPCDGTRPGSVSGYVRQDTNGDSIGDVGLGSVLVTMSWGQGESVTMWTGSNGFYIFTAYPPGTYTIAVTAPPDYDVAPDTAAVLSVLLTCGEIDRDNDFVLVLDTDGDLPPVIPPPMT
jgi:hypothetical protein